MRHFLEYTQDSLLLSCAPYLGGIRSLSALLVRSEVHLTRPPLRYLKVRKNIFLFISYCFFLYRITVLTYVIYTRREIVVDIYISSSSSHSRTRVVSCDINRRNKKLKIPEIKKKASAQNNRQAGILRKSSNLPSVALACRL